MSKSIRSTGLVRGTGIVRSGREREREEDPCVRLRAKAHDM